MVKVKVEIHDLDGIKSAEIVRVKRLVIRAPFGAMKARCFIELYQSERGIPVDHGWRCQVYIHEQLKFRGEIVGIRRDSSGDELSLYATREPERTMTDAISLTLEQMTPTDMLEYIVAAATSSPIQLLPVTPVAHLIDKIRFAHFDLFYAIDLLAKLSGNYLWDIDWENRLRFRPHLTPADHILHFDHRKVSLKIWKSTERVCNYFELFGGVVDENEFLRIFVDESSLARYGTKRESLFVRPIITEKAYLYFRQAVLEQAGHPIYEKYIDLYKEDVSIRFGDTLQLINTGFAHVDESRLFRVKMEEITLDPSGRLGLRYYLAEGWESASRFLRYQDHEKGEPAEHYVARRTGSFALDFSALDSSAHVD